MPTYNIRSGDLRGIQRELDALFKKHNKERQKRIKRAVATAARATAQYVRQRTVPIAFKELVESIVVETLEELEGGGFQVTISADAPHAAAVEEGSRPHVPPLEPLIAWVKLRGMQGLQTNKQLRRLRGSTTFKQARSIAQIIRDHQHPSGYTPINVPEQIARAIQASIARGGTKPYRYMMKAVPFAAEALFEHVAAAVPDQ